MAPKISNTFVSCDVPIMALTIEEDRIIVRKQNSVQIKAVKILANKMEWEPTGRVHVR